MQARDERASGEKIKFKKVKKKIWTLYRNLQAHQETIYI